MVDGVRPAWPQPGSLSQAECLVSGTRNKSDNFQ